MESPSSFRIDTNVLNITEVGGTFSGLDDLFEAVLSRLLDIPKVRQAEG